MYYIYFAILNMTKYFSDFKNGQKKNPFLQQKKFKTTKTAILGW